jgi:hypothetical protein
VAAVETFAASNTVILVLADEPAAGTIEKTQRRLGEDPGDAALGEGVELRVQGLAEGGGAVPVSWSGYAVVLTFSG